MGWGAVAVAFEQPVRVEVRGRTGGCERGARRGCRRTISRPTSSTPSGVSDSLDRGQEVVERLVGAHGIAGCVEVHEQAADDGKHDGG